MVFQALELVILVYDKYHALKSRQRAAIPSYDNWHLNLDVLPEKKRNYLISYELHCRMWYFWNIMSNLRFKYYIHFIFAACSFYSDSILLQYKRRRICSMQLLGILQSKFYALKNYYMSCHHAISDEMKSQQVVFTRDCYFR